MRIYSAALLDLNLWPYGGDVAIAAGSIGGNDG
jgi:hypothetical protein